MPLASMTGFARADGVAGRARLTVELRSVNAKGLDMRLRLPPTFDGVEPAMRAELGKRFSRGSVSATVTVQRESAAAVVRVNEEALVAVLVAAERISGRFAVERPRLDGLLAVRGVLEVAEPEEGPEERLAVEAALVETFARAADALALSRLAEGESLGRILEERLAAIAALAEAAEQNPARRPEAIRQRLGEQVQALFAAEPRLDPDRLHQEAALLAMRADIREEIDRLKAHVSQARDLLAAGGPVGRRLDFLAQELGRETNTLCAKSNDLALTAIGLDMKAAVEQFREQVQNLE